MGDKRLAVGDTFKLSKPILVEGEQTHTLTFKREPTARVFRLAPSLEHGLLVLAMVQQCFNLTEGEADSLSIADMGGLTQALAPFLADVSGAAG